MPDLLPSMDGVSEWEDQVAQMCPALSGRNGEKPKPTDIIAACPMEPDSDFGLLLQTLTLSAEMQSAQRPKEEASEAASGADSSGRNAMTKEQLLWPLFSPEFVPVNAVHSKYWCANPKPYFGGLLQEIYSSQRDVEGHVVIPVLVPTFSAPNHVLDVEAVPTVCDDLKIFSEIHMSNIVRQATLRDRMKEHLGKIVHQLAMTNDRLLSVLHLHVHMKQDHAQDIVDYLHFQIEWFAKELADGLKSIPDAAAVHVLALVVHSVRGCEPELSMRPFLLAGPCLGERPHPTDAVNIFPWTGVAVDHFSHLLPWGMRSEDLSDGTIANIFGLEEAETDRFCLILADSLPHIVPNFGHAHSHADSFTIVQTLMQQISGKPELVRCIRAVLAEKLSLEEAKRP